MFQRFTFPLFVGLVAVLLAGCQAEAPAVPQTAPNGATPATAAAQGDAGTPGNTGLTVQPGTVFAEAEQPAEPTAVPQPGIVSGGAEAKTGETAGADPAPDTTMVTRSDDERKSGGEISVTGVGQASAAADLATLNLGVEAYAKSVKEARDQAAAANKKVVDALLKAGIEEKDIATRYFNIGPRYGREGDTVIGYWVSNQLSVKTRDLAGVGELIDAVTEAGGDLTRFQGVDFGIEDPKPLEVKARAAAVADAKSKAAQLADLLDLKVGPAVSVAEDRGFYPAQPRAVFAEASFALDGPPTQIRAGEVDVTVTVQTVFAIE